MILGKKTTECREEEAPEPGSLRRCRVPRAQPRGQVSGTWERGREMGDGPSYEALAEQ